VRKEIEFWRFVQSSLDAAHRSVLLVVAESSGSSPGRAGYKMAVAANGELYGSIGGGIMEVRLVEKAKTLLSQPGAVATGSRPAEIIEQIHQKHSPDASGMICSGRQTVIYKLLTFEDSQTVDSIFEAVTGQRPAKFEISNLGFQIIGSMTNNSRQYFSKTSDSDFLYQEHLCTTNELVIIGGGHCALALSELMSKLDFHVSIFDDRPELNTIEKNQFADSVEIIDSYENIAKHLPDGDGINLVVMTVGFLSDAVVIRQLIDRQFKYFGVLGSKAKMATLMKELRDEGIDAEKLARIRAPIGLPINSHTPEEIAVSIAAEIIASKNGATIERNADDGA
jgi:xanthine dehydrogenase accessory factor